jgi:hypothetical protein
MVRTRSSNDLSSLFMCYWPHADLNSSITFHKVPHTYTIVMCWSSSEAET